MSQQAATLGVAIVDLDGCLCDASWREHFADCKNWDAYHSRCFDDPVFEVEAKLVRWWVANGGQVIYCTARTTTYRRETVEWLRVHELPTGELFMRGVADKRSSVDLKYSVLRTILERGHRIAFAMDDNDSVVRMYRAEGITCIQPRSESHSLDGDSKSHPAAPLIRAAEHTYKERRATYGASEQKFGNVMEQLFPSGVSLKTQKDWARFGLLTQLVSKLCRYTHDPIAGHVDSIHDLGVYSFMLEAEDRKDGGA